MENKDFNLRNYLYNNPLLEKEDSKKGNLDMQKKMEGAIRDNRDHKKALDKDIASDEKKLAKLKKDAKGEKVKKGNKEEQKRYEGAIRDNRDHKKALDKDIEADEKKLARLKKDYKKDISEAKEEEDDKKKDVKEAALRKAIQNEIISILKEAEVEDVDVDTEEDIDVEDTEEVDVDVDTEVDIDDESAESEIEVDSELAGEDADTAAVLGLLTKAQEEAEALGDEKLMDQIGNTITYYTRAHVVKSGESRAELGENNRFTKTK